MHLLTVEYEGQYSKMGDVVRSLTNVVGGDQSELLAFVREELEEVPPNHPSEYSSFLTGSLRLFGKFGDESDLKLLEDLESSPNGIVASSAAREGANLRRRLASKRETSDKEDSVSSAELSDLVVEGSEADNPKTDSTESDPTESNSGFWVWWVLITTFALAVGWVAVRRGRNS